MSLLLTTFVVILAAAALFFVARRFGLADPQSAAIAAIGTVFVLAALLIGHGPGAPEAPTRQLTSLPVTAAVSAPPLVTFPVANVTGLKRAGLGKGSIDVVVMTPPDGGSYNGAAKTVNAKVGTVVSVQGWAVDSPRAHAGGGVVAYVDGRPTGTGPYGFDRADVAQYLNVPGYRFSGYHVDLPTNLSTGSHSLQLALISADGKSYELFGPALKLTIDR